MKTSLKLSIALVALLVASAAPIYAQAPDTTPTPGSHPGGGGNSTAGSDHVANATEARERHDALVAARQAALDSFHENRTKIIDTYNATLHAIRASFLENKTKVLDACATARNETSGNESNTTAKCVSDGLKPLIEKARADMKSARETALQALADLRASALGSFANAKAAANAKYGRPSSG